MRKAAPSSALRASHDPVASPDEVEAVRRVVEPFLRMTVEERMKAFERLQREMDALSAGQPAVRHPADEEFWRHWMDPSLGRPR